MNYLALVNKVLVRLREPEVTSVQESPYSKLIGEFVNITKREIEDANDWGCLKQSISLNTVATQSEYSLTGSNTRTRILDVENLTPTNKYELLYQTREWFDQAFRQNNPTSTEPYYYNISGVDSNGQLKFKFFPIPDAVYNLDITVINPQEELENDGDILTIPYQMVIEGALARAISERGDDGGYTEQEVRYRSIVSDYIAIDAGHRYDEQVWYPV